MRDWRGKRGFDGCGRSGLGAWRNGRGRRENGASGGGDR